MSPHSAGEPIETPRHPVGRRVALLADPARDAKVLGVDVWYPAGADTGKRSEYELLPGVTFHAAAAQPDVAPAAGRFPLVVFSHGRTGMRFAYSLLCEALAARGAVVVAADHSGDTLADFLFGTFVDDRTNEMGRVADAHALIAAATGTAPGLPGDLVDAVDPERVAIVGHSYGAYTGLATAAGARGVDPHPLVRAVVGLQPYTRVFSDNALGRVRVPTMLAVSMDDRTTPPDTDADRPWAIIPGRPSWRLDLPGAGHQASSDIGLYSELVEHVPDLPDVVRMYLAATAADAVGGGLRPWRTLLREQVVGVWAFLTEVLDLSSSNGDLGDVGDLGEAVLHRR
jgi:predicted dienelactone hydrolase